MGALRQMLKHRYHEEALSRWLETLEESLGLPTLHDVRRAGAMLAVAENRNPIKNRWLRSVRNGGRPAFEVWARLLVLLAIVDATLGILSIVGVLHSHG
jgi:DNA-binding phage protein